MGAGVERMAARTADVIGRPIPSDTAAVIISGIGAIGGLALGGCDAREAQRCTGGLHPSPAPLHPGHHRLRGHPDQGRSHSHRRRPRRSDPGPFRLVRGPLRRVDPGFLRLRGAPQAEWFEWDRKTDAERLEVRAAALDSLDDAISNASDLLTMSQSWREAWRNEQGPVREDLASFRKLCSSVQAKGELDITQERIWLKASLDRMAAMTNEMEAGALSPSAALDELDTISQDVRTRAESLARRALKADTSSYRNGRLHRYESSQSRRVRNSDAYAGWWLFDGHRISYDPASTIRINPSSVGANASGVHWTGAGWRPTSRRRSPISSPGTARRRIGSRRRPPRPPPSPTRAVSPVVAVSPAAGTSPAPGRVRISERLLLWADRGGRGRLLRTKATVAPSISFENVDLDGAGARRERREERPS